MMNDSPDLQRTPQYTQPRRGIPVPEKDIMDPVAEYNKGEIVAMDWVEIRGLKAAQENGDRLLSKYELNPDFVQGYFDALKVLHEREGYV